MFTSALCLFEFDVVVVRHPNEVSKCIGVGLAVDFIIEAVHPLNVHGNPMTNWFRNFNHGPVVVRDNDEKDPCLFISIFLAFVDMVSGLVRRAI